VVLAGAPILSVEIRGAVSVEGDARFVSALEAEAGDARGLLLDFSRAETRELSDADVIGMADVWKASRFGNELPFAAHSTKRGVRPIGNMLLARWNPASFSIFPTEREAIEWLAKRVRSTSSS
jgi:hypothetical protein